jgi:uncharacterized protein HemX
MSNENTFESAATSFAKKIQSSNSYKEQTAEQALKDTIEQKERKIGELQRKVEFLQEKNKWYQEITRLVIREAVGKITYE